MKMVRQARAQNADLAGPGNVDQVRLETLENVADQRNVTKERRIKAQILFQNERKKTARQLEGPYATFLDQGRSAMACAHAKKGQVASPREVFKMAAGMCNPIHFVERVWKVCNARQRCGHL